MGHDLASLTGASAPVGQNLEDLVAPLTMKDWADFEVWMKRQPFVALNGVPLSPEERKVAVEAATKMSFEINIFGYDGVKILNSPSGISMWLFLSMRAKDSRFADLEKCQTMVNLHGKTALIEVLNKINGLDSGNAGSPAEGQ